MITGKIKGYNCTIIEKFRQPIILFTLVSILDKEYIDHSSKWLQRKITKSCKCTLAGNEI